MQRKIVFFLFLGLLSTNCMGNASTAAADPRLQALVKQQMQVLNSGYMAFLANSIVPAMQQGAGGTAQAPLVIPPIFPNGYQPDPAQPPSLDVMLEPVGQAVAYAGLFCKGVGLDPSADVSRVYIRLPTFSRVRTQVFKSVAAGLLSDPAANNQNNLSFHLSNTTMQCKAYLRDMCTSGACNSGKCGKSLSLGAACNALCEEAGFLRNIRVCTQHFYVGQVVPKSAVMGANPNIGASGFNANHAMGY